MGRPSGLSSFGGVMNWSRPGIQRSHRLFHIHNYNYPKPQQNCQVLPVLAIRSFVNSSIKLNEQLNTKESVQHIGLLSKSIKEHLAVAKQKREIKTEENINESDQNKNTLRQNLKTIIRLLKLGSPDLKFFLLLLDSSFLLYFTQRQL